MKRFLPVFVVILTAVFGLFAVGCSDNMNYSPEVAPLSDLPILDPGIAPPETLNQAVPKEDLFCLEITSEKTGTGTCYNSRINPCPNTEDMASPADALEDQCIAGKIDLVKKSKDFAIHDFGSDKDALVFDPDGKILDLSKFNVVVEPILDCSEVILDGGCFIVKKTVQIDMTRPIGNSSETGEENNSGSAETEETPQTNIILPGGAVINSVPQYTGQSASEILNLLQ